MKDIIQNIQNLLWYDIKLHDKEDLLNMLKSANTDNFEKEKVEKDFYLTVMLHRISQNVPEISFKWWTCLNKIYFPYFRLSEDLDFSISIEDELVNTNGKREKFAQYFREKIKELTNTMWRTLNEDRLHHKKAQWNEELKNKEYTYLKYIISYSSVYDIEDQEIKIELTYTTRQYFASIQQNIQSLFVESVTEANIFKDQTISCLSIDEMITEKCRACLTRRKPAIRDFFDLRYIQSQWIDILAHKDIIKAKCDEVSDRKRTLHDNYDELQKQIHTDLLPVATTLYNFDLNDIYEKMIALQKELFN